MKSYSLKSSWVKYICILDEVQIATILLAEVQLAEFLLAEVLAR